MAIGRSPRLNDIVGAVRKLADGRLCSTVPMEHAVVAALEGDKSHQVEFRRALKARADLTISRGSAPCPGSTARRADGSVFTPCRRCALPKGKTDEDFVKAMLHETGVLSVYGSGFGLPAEEGFLPNRVPGAARRAQRNLRFDGRLHGRLLASVATDAFASVSRQARASQRRDAVDRLRQSAIRNPQSPMLSDRVYT